MSITGRIVCHPANADLLREALYEAQEPPHPVTAWQQHSFHNRLSSIHITLNDALDRTQPTGRLVTPDGQVHEPAGFSYRWRRFITLEENDLAWALPLGIVRYEYAPVFYLVNTSFFTARMSPFLHEPRHMFISTIS